MAHIFVVCVEELFVLCVNTVEWVWKRGWRMRVLYRIMRGFCAVAVLVQLVSCKGGGKAPGVDSLLQGKGVLGDVGDIVRGYAANSRVMIDIRSQIAIIVSKLNMITLRRVHDFTSEDKVEKIESWMDTVAQRVFNVTFKRAKSCVDELRQDLSTLRPLRSLVFHAWMRGSWPARDDTMAYDLLYRAMLPGLWVEFLNYRALCLAGMLNSLQYSLESLGAKADKLEKLKTDLQSVASSAPV